MRPSTRRCGNLHQANILLNSLIKKGRTESSHPTDSSFCLDPLFLASKVLFPLSNFIHSKKEEINDCQRTKKGEKNKTKKMYNKK